VYMCTLSAPSPTRSREDESTAAGDHARLLPQVPMKMKLATYTAAMLPLTPVGTAGALVVRLMAEGPGQRALPKHTRHRR